MKMTLHVHVRALEHSITKILYIKVSKIRLIIKGAILPCYRGL